MEIDLLYIAIAVFVLLLTGLFLTVIEFRHGEPKRQDEEGLTPNHPGR